MIIDDFSGEYAFLSNFAVTPFFWYGTTYLTSEHAYQAAKATSETDWKRVVLAPTAGECKKVGRKIKVRPDWETMKYPLMMDILFHKFKSKHLAELLVATGDAMLVEGNTWHDQIWGNCMCPKHKDILGQNWLGQSLMFTRDKIGKLL